jgi:uncharacterized protein Yka (UPF0111/DUF47 family)
VEDGLVKQWFLPRDPKVLELLEQQAEITVRGLRAFADWSAGDVATSDAVAAAEHEADETRRALQRELRAAFSTPLDPEDIYELSERLDAVLNAAKNAVREAEVMHLEPNDALASMAAELLVGAHELREGLDSLKADPDRATRAADAAIKSERRIEKAYRKAMSDLVEVDDLHQVIAWREMYRRYSRIGEALAHVAERVWYAVVKEA